VITPQSMFNNEEIDSETSKSPPKVPPSLKHKTRWVAIEKEELKGFFFGVVA
jgi:hypothetical protein